MHEDARGIREGSLIETDIAVVGAGAAGIALANELQPTGARICLLESGTFEYDEASQRLCEGSIAGQILEHEEAYLIASRTRGVGGTTSHWDGYCRPLDPMDFEERPWVPDSGWPIRRADLDPYYVRACPYLEIPPWDEKSDKLSHETGPVLFPPEAPVETSFFHASPPTRMGQKYCDLLTGAANIRLLTFANATRIRTNPTASRVEGLTVRTLAGNAFEVAARHYVLAAGGIENPRLLLLSDDVQKTGLGNAHDNVGRYFSDHPVSQQCFASLPGMAGLMHLYFHQRLKVLGRVQAILRLSSELQRERKLLNMLFLFNRPKGSDETALKWPVNSLAVAMEGLAPGAGKGKDAYLGRVLVAAEQAPNRDSRVSLGEERDGLGLPRVKLEWRMGEIDAASMRESFHQLALAFGRHQLGRLSFAPDPARPWAAASWSAHHMGTTRMHRDPARGVVDPECRVHGIDNLWVAGSSVFPTVGCSNPTLTIVALAVALADRLRGRLQG